MVDNCYGEFVEDKEKEKKDNMIKLINEMFDYPVSIIDLGCGSGCIGLSLKKKLNTSM